MVDNNKQIMRLTPKQVLQIPELIQKRTQGEVAESLHVHVSTIVYWIKRLKKDGLIKNVKMGRPAIRLAKTDAKNK